MKRLVTFALLIWLLTGSLALAQYYQHTPNVGGVNWSDQVVRATGYGAPNPNMPPGAQRAGAIEAAKITALRNLLQVVKGMFLDSQTTIENAMVSSDRIETQVSGIVRNFRIVDTRYMSTGDIEVDVEVPLSAFYDMVSQLPGGLPPTVSATQPVNNANNLSQNTAYSGLIIDAVGLRARPALAPKVFDEAGNEVYGTGYVGRDYAIQVGVVGYDKDLNRARSNERVAGNPLIIKALRVEGPNKTDLVISNADAEVIRQAAVTMNFLEQCKVMIILD